MSPLPKMPRVPGAPKPPKAKKVRFPWLGNKMSEPRMPGSGKGRRMGQLENSGYGSIKMGAAFAQPKIPAPKIPKG